jgi:hypothetical protein
MTGNWQTAMFPPASVAVQVTSVLPGGKRLPEGGTHTRSGAGSRQSLADTVKLTTSPAGLPTRSGTSRDSGQASAGGVVSGGKPHLARKLSWESKAAAKLPPAKSAGPLPSSKTAKASTEAFIPLPSADQLEPSHRAMRLASTPPALVKPPPA